MRMVYICSQTAHSMQEAGGRSASEAHWQGDKRSSCKFILILTRSQDIHIFTIDLSSLSVLVHSICGKRGEGARGSGRVQAACRVLHLITILDTQLTAAPMAPALEPDTTRGSNPACMSAFTTPKWK